MRMVLLVVAILILWVSMFLAADSGYRAWQRSPNPPQAAFADTGPIFFLLAGWIPGSGIVCALFLLSRLIWPPRASTRSDSPPLPVW